MNRVLEFNPDGRRDFDEAADWYNDQKPRLKVEFIRAVDEILAAILSAPRSFQLSLDQMLDVPSCEDFHTQYSSHLSKTRY